MAIIVMHTETEQNFVFLGAGFGSWATDKPGILGFSDRNEGQQSVCYVCDASGQIIKMRPADITVVSVDGQNLSDVLGPPPASPELR